MALVRILTDVTQLEALVPAWRKLLASAARSEPVQTPLWLLAWWRQFGGSDGRALRVIAIEDGGNLIGLVPLVLRTTLHRRAIPVRRLELLATGEDERDEIASEYVGGLAARGAEEQVAHQSAEAITANALGEWDELRMSAMSGDDLLVPRLADALRRGGLAAAVTRSGEAHFIPLPKSWRDYLNELGSSQRYTVTRSLRELDKWAGKGQWELRTAANATEFEEGKRALHELHAARWAQAGKAGVFASPRFKAFHDEVMPRLWAKEDGTALELMWLAVRGEPIAAAYNIIYDDKVYFYQGGRRVDLPRNVRPGIALHALAIQRSIELGRREYDFLEGKSRYKRDFALAARSLVTLRAVAPHLRGRAVEAVRMLAERTIARVRQVRTISSPNRSQERAAE